MNKYTVHKPRVFRDLRGCVNRIDYVGRPPRPWAAGPALRTGPKPPRSPKDAAAECDFFLSRVMLPLLLHAFSPFVILTVEHLSPFPAEAGHIRELRQLGYQVALMFNVNYFFALTTIISPGRVF
jgi:hypothetical protein